MNRMSMLALALLSLPFAVEAAAQAAAPSAEAAATPPKAVGAVAPKPGATNVPATPKAAAAPAGATGGAAAQKTAATGTIAVPQRTAGMSQQDRMRQCSKEATGKKGAERKTFMKACLSVKKTV